MDGFCMRTNFFCEKVFSETAETLIYFSPQSDKFSVVCAPFDRSIVYWLPLKFDILSLGVAACRMPPGILDSSRSAPLLFSTLIALGAKVIPRLPLAYVGAQQEDGLSS